MTDSNQDQWAQWLLHRRHGDDAERQRDMLRQLHEVRDNVLQHTRLADGETLLDVGCGDGLIAFGALPLVGEHGKVIFSDISQDLLEHCQALAAHMKVLKHCQLVCASADNLSNIEKH